MVDCLRPIRAREMPVNLSTAVANSSLVTLAKRDQKYKIVTPSFGEPKRK